MRRVRTSRALVGLGRRRPFLERGGGANDYLRATSTTSSHGPRQHEPLRRSSPPTFRLRSRLTRRVQPTPAAPQTIPTPSKGGSNGRARIARWSARHAAHGARCRSERKKKKPPAPSRTTGGPVPEGSRGRPHGQTTRSWHSILRFNGWQGSDGLGGYLDDPRDGLTIKARGALGERIMSRGPSSREPVEVA